MFTPSPCEARLASMERDTSTDSKTIGTTDTVSLREYAKLEKELQSLKQEFHGYRKAMSAKVDSLKKEVRSSESSDQNPTDEPEENSLPIQQITKIWKVGGNIRANKTEHAAAIWSDFFDRSKSGRDVYYLPTDKVEQILREHFRSDQNHLGVTENVKRATVHRAMDALEDLAGNLVSSDIIRNGRRALMINQQEFAEFAEAIGAVTDDVTPDNGSSVTSGG
jgi:hypothetical protein